MDMKAVTLEEAQEMQGLLEGISFQSQGTIAGQYAMLSKLVAFQAKLAAAIKEEEDAAGLAPAT